MFLKNIEALKKVNKELADRLEKIDLEDIVSKFSFTMSPTNNYVLIKNDIALDDLTDPVESARLTLKNEIHQNLGDNDFIIIFGLGLGYLLDETFETYKSKIILYEPDIDILRFAFEYVDFSKHLESLRVLIVDDVTVCVNYLFEKYLLKDKVEVIYLKNYAITNVDKLTHLTQRVYDICKIKIVDMNTIKKLAKIWACNILDNVKHKYELLDSLSNKYSGKTAMILAAGPSLKDNIEQIKKYRDKFVIFAINRVFPTLQEHGIIPDYVVFSDAQYIKKSIHVEESFFKDVNIITDIKADQYVYTLPCKQLYVYHPTNEALSLKLRDSAGIELFETAGTSTITAYLLARKMGFKNIAFCGFDLAFKYNIAYCDNTIAKVEADSAMINSIVKNIIRVKSVNGQMVKTTDDYAVFIKQFEEILKANGDTNVYGITDFGAYIEGVKYVSVDDVANLTQTKSIPLTEQKSSDYKKSVQNAVKEEKSALEDIKYHINAKADERTIIAKIMRTIFLSQCLQFELIDYTNIALSDDKDKKETFYKEFFEKTLKDIDTLLSHI